jgi:RNA polymerase sigma-70 factor (ECF subfamily)
MDVVLVIGDHNASAWTRVTRRSRRTATPAMRGDIPTGRSGGGAAMSGPDFHDDPRLGDWLARCALGDRQAFRQLYETTSPRVLGVIARLVGRGATAEDLLQDVYVKVWKSAGQYRAGAGAPMAWLCATARYRAIDWLRAQGARPEIAASELLSASASDDDEGPGPAERLADPNPGPAARVEARAEAGAVQACLGTLAATQQQSISLAYYQGLSHGEIAEHLGAPLGSVKTWVRRGLLALKACLERGGWTEAVS